LNIDFLLIICSFHGTTIILKACFCLVKGLACTGELERYVCGSYSLVELPMLVIFQVCLPGQ